MKFKKGCTPWTKGKHLTEEHKNKIGAANKGNVPWNKGKKQTKEHNKKISDALKGRTQTKTHRENLSKSLKGKRNTPKTEFKNGHIGYWNGKKRSEESKLKMSEAAKGRVFSEETRKKMSKSRMGHVVSKETRQKMREARLRQVLPQKDTSIEIMMQKELTRRGIMFEKNIPIEKICQPDIVLRDKKTIIQCDGDYWHSLEKNIKRDKKQDASLKKLGWNVFRYSGTEIRKDVAKCVDETFLRIERNGIIG